jgi:lysophospholipase L1-like esterase
MTQRVVSVGDDFALPAGTKVLDSHLPARLADAALNSNYASTAALAAKAGISDIGTSKASRVFRLACLGNSLYDGTSSADTNVYDANPETIYTDSTWYNIAIAMSMGKIARGGNFGIGGQTTAQVVARVPDVIAANPKPNACALGEGTNTIGGGADDAATLAAADLLISGADQLAAAGIIPIIINCPTRGNTAVPKTDDERRRVALYNVRLARLASLRGYPLVDWHRVSVDQTSGKFMEAATTDGVHFTKLYNRKAAEAVLDVVLPMAGGYVPFLANWNADPTNLLSNGLFLGSTSVVSSYPMPASWNGGANNQRAITAPVAADKILGNWFDVWKDATVAAATATDYTTYQPAVAAGASTFAVGDRMRFAARVRIEDIENAVVSTGSGHFAGLTLFIGGANVNMGPMYQYQINVTDALAVIEFTVPAGATTIQPQIGMAGQGKIRVAQMTLRNLTKLGAL